MSSLKDLLRTICISKKWCYAVFWKMDLQNPRFLAWEECYSEHASNMASHGAQCSSNDMDKVNFLIPKLMMKHQVVLVGQGLLGNAIFTGNYKWILLNSYYDIPQLSEVIDDVQLHILIGLQTVVVIPAYPFGVVQLGSSFSIVENKRFVSAVQSLILQMGYGHGCPLPSAVHFQLEPTRACVAGINAMRSSAMVPPMPQNSVQHSNRLSSVAEIGFERGSLLNAEDQSCTTTCSMWSGNDLYDVVAGRRGDAAADMGINDSFSDRLDDAWADASFVLGTQDSNSDFYSDNLLDAVVSQASSSGQKASGDLLSFVETPNVSAGGPVSIAFAADANPDVPSCSQSASFFVPLPKLTSWAGIGVVRESSTSTAFSKKNDEIIPRPIRKRARPGESTRPRPRDRQMIQDRVKELREIIPSGAKCSIDALLEKTIKHMLFLQNVAKHADKLKEIGESKFVIKEGELRLRNGFEGGAMWACEVGSESLACPIIVEDLNSPRHLLIEMVCEEGGLLLEIANLVRGMGLTILKGVVEAFDDKIWARFAVEANRDVTRIEIFTSLVSLLEDAQKSCGPKKIGLPEESVDTQSVISLPVADSS